MSCGRIFGIELQWERLAPIPDRLGFAGSFAGVSGGALLVAGGANFPGKMPSEGGTKVWHDDVFVLETFRGEWRAAGRLARPLGHGIAVTHRRGVVCIGGSDATQHHASTLILRWAKGRLETERLPEQKALRADLEKLGFFDWIKQSS